MYCPKCGKELEPGTRFCPECGNLIVNDRDIISKLNLKEIKIAGRSFSLITLVTFISSIVLIMACFLPFVSVGYYGISIANAGSDFIIFIILALLISGLVYFKKDLLALCVAIVTVVFMLVELNGVKSIIGSIAHLSMGAYLMIVAIAGLFISTLLIYLYNKRVS